MKKEFNTMQCPNNHPETPKKLETTIFELLKREYTAQYNREISRFPLIFNVFLILLEVINFYCKLM